MWRSIEQSGRTLVLFFLLLPGILFGQVSQGEVLDKVVAVVGGEIVLQSDIQSQKDQMFQRGMSVDANTDCALLEQSMYQKILLHKAKVDSVTVTESRVESEIDRRLRYFIQQVGSKEKLEEFYGMSIEQIKENFKSMIREQMRVQRMRSKITENVNITPTEVKEYYEGLNEDSIPRISSKVKMAHIVKSPEVDKEALEKTKKQLQEYRQAILDEEKSFSVLATLYSDDPGSAENGGELGIVKRGEMDPDFEAVLFSLKEGEISKPFKTQFGFHIVQAQDILGQKVKARHILLKPEVSPDALDQAKKELDSIARVIRLNDTLSFEEAALEYSDDDDTRKNGGLIVNERSGSSMFEMDELRSDAFFVIDKMKVGEISKPVPYSKGERKSYRIIKLLERTAPHKANLDQDYEFIKKKAKEEKEQEVLYKWVNDRIDETYVKVEDRFKDCEFRHHWLEKNSQ